MEERKLEGKVGVVIGATRGIGRAIALRMAQLGMNITAVARKEEELSQLARDIESLNVTCLPIRARRLPLLGRNSEASTYWSILQVPV